MKYIRKTLEDIFFPPFCTVCKRFLEEKKDKKLLLCKKCLNDIEINSSLYCSNCKKRMPAQEGIKRKSSCCNSFKLLAACSYSNPKMRNLLLAFKYEKLRSTKRSLKYVVRKYLTKIGISTKIKGWTIVPIPLHPSKERERGFNQADEIGKVLGEILSLPKERLLARVKKTKSQINMTDYQERKTNLKEAFMVTKSPNKIKNRKILLVDDVFTSGSTMKEAVETLKEAGAKKIVGLVVARA